MIKKLIILYFILCTFCFGLWKPLKDHTIQLKKGEYTYAVKLEDIRIAKHHNALLVAYKKNNLSRGGILGVVADDESYNLAQKWMAKHPIK
jgi:hypothetical protein